MERLTRIELPYKLRDIGQFYEREEEILEEASRQVGKKLTLSTLEPIPGIVVSDNYKEYDGKMHKWIPKDSIAYLEIRLNGFTDHLIFLKEDRTGETINLQILLS